MSVPPLVCSTPPPPDHCDDEVEDDDFSFQYTESSLSPSNQFDGDKFSYVPTYGEKIACEAQAFSHTISKNTVELSPDRSVENLDKSIVKEYEKNSSAPSEYQNTKPDFEEDNNIEDLDLKLDNLQIDFQNGKESVEDSLNENFDNFGTFYSSSTMVDSPETSYYLPKIEDVQINDVYEKDPKSHETFSDASLSIQNEDNSDVDVALEIPHDSVNVPEEISTGPDDTETVDKESNFFQIQTTFPISNDNDSNESPSDNTCPNCAEICICSTSNIFNENITDAFVVDWNENKYDECTTIENRDIQMDVTDFPLTSDDESKDNANIDINAEIDSGLDLFTSFDKKDDGNDDFDDFTTFQSGENTDVINSSQAFAKVSTEIEKENFQILENKFIDEDLDIEKKSSNESNSGQNNQNLASDDDDDDDDFGDFDAYNPCDKTNVEAVSKSNSESDLAIDEFILTNDSTATEKLNLAIKNIFADEVNSKDDCEVIDSNLELKTILGESWNHLINYEAEQSYLFTWNSSASQKSLLKSLGIDSRNILFGPKWNSNMPRFAANLGTNPLQPVKHVVNQSISDQVSDRKNSITSEVLAVGSPPSKEYDWDNGSHLASTDFQASCNERVEDVSNPMQSLDIPNLQEEPNKAEKPLHPNVLNIGRKINLPDTHIFTPTDSETPWSHTIHYNDENYNDFHSSVSNDLKTMNSEVIPDSKIENISKSESVDDFDDFQCHKIDDNMCFENVTDVKLNTPDIPNNIKSDFTQNVVICNPLVKSTLKNEETDDFGDFQTANSSLSSIPKFSNNSDLLKPVKISTITSTPVVNWPEPGEVKSLDLDDFNDFNSVSFTQIPPNINSNINNFTNPSDLTYLPNSTLGPTQYILKESKIETNTNNVDDTYTEPIQTNVNENLNCSQKPTDFSIIQHDGFSNFISNLNNNKIPSTNIDIDKQVVPQMKTFDQFNVDDFDDFQSANFVPQLKNIEKSEISHFPTSNNDFSLSFQTNLKPTTNYSPQFDKPLEPMNNRRQSTEFISKNSSQQILQPLSLENYSQINWPNPGMDIQDFTRFNPVNSIKSYSEVKDTTKNISSINNDQSNDDDWSDFVSIKPTTNSSVKPVMPNMLSCNGFGITNITNPTIDDSEDWSDFVSSTTTPKNNNELKTISQNIHSQSNINTPSYTLKNSNPSMPRSKTALQNNVPTNVNVLPNLTYVSPKANINKTYNNHFQNL